MHLRVTYELFLQMLKSNMHANILPAVDNSHNSQRMHGITVDILSHKNQLFFAVVTELWKSMLPVICVK